LQDEEKKQGSMSREEIELPNADNTMGMRHGTYDKLDEDGLVPPGRRGNRSSLFIACKWHEVGLCSETQAVTYCASHAYCVHPKNITLQACQQI
jgi:hypothetical protein